MFWWDLVDGLWTMKPEGQMFHNHQDKFIDCVILNKTL